MLYLFHLRLEVNKTNIQTKIVLITFADSQFTLLILVYFLTFSFCKQKYRANNTDTVYRLQSYIGRLLEDWSLL